jgi:hypothetical protein
MSARLECGTCHGTYSTTQADGALYCHACPPTGTKPDGTSIERANKRDENLALDSQGKAIGIKAEGSGATAV